MRDVARSVFGFPIVAFVGAIGSGKSTAADALAARGWRRLSFAYPLKKMVEQLWDVDPWTQEGKQEKLTVVRPGTQHAFTEVTVRKLLELVGTEGLRNIDENVWLNLAAQRLHRLAEEASCGVSGWLGTAARGIPLVPGVVVDDARYPNEFKFLKNVGAHIVRLERIGADPQRTGHASDSHWETVEADAIMRVQDGLVDVLQFAIHGIGGKLEAEAFTERIQDDAGAHGYSFEYLADPRIGVPPVMEIRRTAGPDLFAEFAVEMREDGKTDPFRG